MRCGGSSPASTCRLRGWCAYGSGRSCLGSLEAGSRPRSRARRGAGARRSSWRSAEGARVLGRPTTAVGVALVRLDGGPDEGACRPRGDRGVRGHRRVAARLDRAAPGDRCSHATASMHDDLDQHPVHGRPTTCAARSLRRRRDGWAWGDVPLLCAREIPGRGRDAVGRPRPDALPFRASASTRSRTCTSTARRNCAMTSTPPPEPATRSSWSPCSAPA